MNTTTSFTHMASNSYGFMLISLSELQGILKEIMLFSRNAPDQHLLLDKGSPVLFAANIPSIQPSRIC